MLRVKKIVAKSIEKVAFSGVGITCPMDWHQPKVPKQLLKAKK